LLKRLASNHWSADFLTLSALALCYSTTKYCSSVWSNIHHCKKLDTARNECLRLISECMSTLTELLPILCDIEPADIRRDKNLLKLQERDMSETHILYRATQLPLVNVRFKSRNPLSTRMHNLTGEQRTTPNNWVNATWTRR